MTYPTPLRRVLAAAVLVAPVACGTGDDALAPLDATTLPAYSRRALERGAPAAELLGGFRFGMSSEEFHRHCREANGAGLMRSGADSYILLADSLGPFDAVEVAAVFDDARELSRLDGRLYARAWSPWRQDLSADSLLADAAAGLRRRLGGAPFAAVAGVRPRTLAQFGPGRRVTVYPDGMQHVRFEVTDLTRAEGPRATGADLLEPALTYPLLSKLPPRGRDDEG